MSRVGPDETAFGDRRAPYSLIITGESVDAAESDRNVQWTRDSWSAVQPFAKEGHYSTYLVGAKRTGSERPTARRPTTGWVALKSKYDPTNAFRLNHNIKPTVL